MGITLKTRKMLWGRSANRCAMPDCRKELVEDETETDDPSVIGDEAHIVAKEENGPRGKSDLTPEQRDTFNNLILLCKNHHKQIDDQKEKFSVSLLHEIKDQHLKWISDNLSPDRDKQRDDEIYATYIDKWIDLAGINHWKAWTSYMLSGGQPQILKEDYDKLRILNEYLLSRIWPKRYLNVEKAFKQFRLILGDLINVFDKHKESRGEESEVYITEKFYKRLQTWDDEAYRKIGAKFDYHVDLVQDLVCELTRSGNNLCDEIRKNISHSYRINEGILLIETGPDSSFSYNTVRLEYEQDQSEYPGLEKFMDIRSQRNYHFGSGVSEDYFPRHFQ